MRSRLTVGEAVPMKPQALQDKLFDHVAIDRFTGGAADAKKFDSRPLVPGPPDQPLFSCRLHLERFEAWMLGLLGLVLKDLNDCDIRVGQATHRGYGLIRGHLQAAEALCLPGSAFEQLCTQYGLTFQDGPSPYRRVDLSQLLVKKDPAGKLLQACHSAFISLISQLGQPSVRLGQLPEQES
jgi:hypothetical protein